MRLVTSLHGIDELTLTPLDLARLGRGKTLRRGALEVRLSRSRSKTPWLCIFVPKVKGAIRARPDGHGDEIEIVQT